MDERQRALELLKDKEDEQLYDILRDADEYRSEVVSGAREELIRRGLPDRLPKSPKVDWAVVAAPGQLPEHRIDPAARKRIRKAVEARHGEGLGYREILLSFEGTERAVAGDMLSRRMDHEAFASVQIGHRLLIAGWTVLAFITFVLSEFTMSELAMTFVYLAIVYSLVTGSRWAYLMASFWGVLGIGVNLLVAYIMMASRKPHSIMAGSGSFPVEWIPNTLLAILFTALAVLAVKLQRRLFPFLRFFDTRRDASGRPSILGLVEDIPSPAEDTERP